MPVDPKRPAPNPWLPWQVLAIVGAVLWIYWPALNGGLQWDDDLYLTKNPLLADPARLWKAWFVPGSFIEYYPITQTVQWVQWQVWHGQTLGYHVTNVLLHAAGALLVWRLLAKLGLRYAWLGGMLFAVHPAHVESVAWISEIKNTLSLPPFLLVMCAWIDFEDGKQPRDFWTAFVLFVVAMLCKITMAPFAFLILLYAWWKRGRVSWADVKAAALFLAVAIVLSALTIHAGQSYRSDVILDVGEPAAGGPASLMEKLALAGSSLAYYLGICLWPVNLLPAYAKWPIDPPSPSLYLPWLILAALVIWAWTMRRTWGRHVLLGLGFFLLFLAPFLGFHWVSYMVFTWVMNHFLYLPCIGLVGIVVAGLEKALELAPKEARPVALVAAGVVVALLAMGAQRYAALYRDVGTLWGYAVQRDPKSFAAQNQFGVVLENRGDVAGALEYFRRAVALQPGTPQAILNVGCMLLESGHPAEATDQFRQALKFAPGYALAHYNLGAALANAGHLDEAIAEYQQSLRLQPMDSEAENYLALTLLQAGRKDEALAHFARAVRISPGYAVAEFDWGLALLQAHDAPEAARHFAQAVHINPSYVEAHYNLGVALYQAGRKPEAVAEFQAALRLRPDYAPARTILTQLGALPK